MIHERPVRAEPRARCFRCREESEDGKTQRKKVSSGFLLSYLQFRDRININDQKAGGGGSREAQALLVPDENPGLADHCGGLFGAGGSMGLELLMSFSVGAGRVFLLCLEMKNQELSSRPRGGPRVELGLAPDSELSEDALQASPNGAKFLSLIAGEGLEERRSLCPASSFTLAPLVPVSWGSLASEPVALAEPCRRAGPHPHVPDGSGCKPRVASILGRNIGDRGQVLLVGLSGPYLGHNW